MSEQTSLGRRDFLVTTGVLGSSLLVGCRTTRSSQSGTRATDERARELNAWVKITASGRVKLIVDKVEMGQGIATLFVGMAVDGLGVDVGDIDFSFAPADEIYINRKIKAKTLNISLPLHVQFTGYSTSTSDVWDTALAAIMGARAKLIGAAAKAWRVPSASITLAEGQAQEKSGERRRIPIGQLIEAAAEIDLRRETLETLQPKKMSRMSRVDLLPKVTGQPLFGVDVTAAQMGVPKLRYAVLVRPDEIGATLQVSNGSELSTMPGFYAAFPILDQRAFAIVADRYWQALKIAKAVRFTADPGPNAAFSSERLIDDYLKMLNKSRVAVRTPIDLGWGAPEKIALFAESYEATYVLPFLPHSTMEPMNASCAFVGGKWSFWVPTQFPEAAESAAARELGIREKELEIVTTYLGGGFGRRLTVDYVTLVAAIGRELGVRKGLENTAVKLLWTREEDFQYDYFRPVACHKISASLDDRGISAWKQEIATQSITGAAARDLISSLIPDRIKNKNLLSIFTELSKDVLDLVNLDPVAVEGAADTDYKFGPFALNAVGYEPSALPRIPLGFWRSVGHSHTCFAIESFIDEIARKYNRSEVDIRRRALRDSPRSLEVLERCLSLSQYSSKVEGGLAMGLARHAGWGSYVAMVVQLGLTERGEVRVQRVWAVVDVGFALQPDIIKQQIEGGIIFGLSATLKQEIVIEKGAVRERNFYDSGDVIRLFESPKILVDIIARPPEVAPTGVGELGVPCVGPAVANAVHKLTGKRVRRLPLTAERLKATALFSILFLCSLLNLLIPEQSQAQERDLSSGPAAICYLYQLASSSRCVNCHGAIDPKSGQHYPTTGEERKPHAMAIDARFPDLGGDCISCHQKKNQEARRHPPGAFSEALPDFFWHMPPRSMILATVKSPRELCELWTDSQRNAIEPGKKGGINDLATFRREFSSHAALDPLVAWAFSPGPGRVPAPGSKAELLKAMDVWIAWLEAGHRCQEL